MPIIITIPTIPSTEDPCVVLSQLEEAWRNMLLGGTARKIRTRTETGAEEEIDFGTGANPALLKAEIEKYKLLCAEKLGLGAGPRQFAARAR